MPPVAWRERSRASGGPVVTHKLFFTNALRPESRAIEAYGRLLRRVRLPPPPPSSRPFGLLAATWPGFDRSLRGRARHDSRPLLPRALSPRLTDTCSMLPATSWRSGRRRVETDDLNSPLSANDRLRSLDIRAQPAIGTRAIRSETAMRSGSPAPRRPRCQIFLRSAEGV